MSFKLSEDTVDSYDLSNTLCVRTRVLLMVGDAVKLTESADICFKVKRFFMNKVSMVSLNCLNLRTRDTVTSISFH
jgi:hypothetical protein